jgi:NAD+ kinase
MRNNMNKFYVITNHDKDRDLELTNLICRYLLENNCTCTYRDGYVVKELVPEDCECAIVLGGDGTLVQAARELCGLNIPLWELILGPLVILLKLIATR